VKVKIGKVTRTVRVNSKRQFRVNFGGFDGGTTSVVIRIPGKPEFKRLYTLCGSGSVDNYNVPAPK
jgi:hypothetical protein